MMDEKPKNDALYPIQIRLKGGDGTSTFQPGEMLSGSIEIHPPSKISCRAVEIRIGWYTQGKGRREDTSVFNRRYEVREISGENPFYEQFDVQLPHTPWSHAGHLISIVWAIQVKIDVALASDYNHEQRIILQPI